MVKIENLDCPEEIHEKTITALIFTFILVACVQNHSYHNPTEDTLTGKLTFSGSTTMQPLVAKLGDEFKLIHPHIALDIAAAVCGRNQGTMMELRILAWLHGFDTDEAQGIQQYQVAIDVLAIIVHPDNPS